MNVSTAPIAVLRNRMALFGWIFMSVWMGMLAIFTYLFHRGGGVPGHSFEWGALFLAMGWLIGLGATVFFFKIPVTSVNVQGGRVILCERWLLRAKVQTFDVKDADSIFVREEKDSEGDPYFICYLRTPDGRGVRIKEAHLREIPEKARAQLLAALRLENAA